MNKKIIELLKGNNYVMPEFLLKNYKKLAISSEQVLFLMYLMNISSPIVCNYTLFSENLNMNINDVLMIINDLKEKKIITVEVKKNSFDKLDEYIDLDNLYSKLFMILTFDDSNEKTNIYDIFEKELSRVISPIEYELINGWLNSYKEDIIIEALKEAVYNGVNNFRYIDKILFEWDKKGIDSIDKVKANKKDFIDKSSSKIEVPDYDWLNDEGNY